MTQNGDKGKGCSERERTENGVLAFGEGREGLLRISSEGDTPHDADDRYNQVSHLSQASLAHMRDARVQ
jgi:hypothetical protein